MQISVETNNLLNFTYSTYLQLTVEMKKNRFRVRLNIIFEICAFGHFLQRSFQTAGERKVPDGMIDRFDQKVKDFPPPLSV